MHRHLLRLVQVYKAERSVDPLRVYNLRYDDSAETDQFSAGLARERRSLESLIADKAHMVLPANPDPTQVSAALLAPWTFAYEACETCQIVTNNS